MDIIGGTTVGITAGTGTAGTIAITAIGERFSWIAD
jgi:hypothetical protein